MYPALTQTQADRRRSDASGEDQQHTGKIISISIPFWDLDLIEEMDLQARMECCSSRSHYFRRLIRRNKAERIKAQRQHDEWVQTWGEK